MEVYLDFNSTAPIDERVLDAMVKIYKNTPGNSDSRTHTFGENARQVVEDARNKVSSLLGVGKDEIIFTSGATESNNIAIQGLKDYAEKTGKHHIITTSIEHKAVLETCRILERQGFEITYVDPCGNGRVSCDEVIKLVRDDTLLVSIMHVNNETGIIQPVKEIGEFLEGKETYFHVDATQSFGKLVDELKLLKYDMLSMSAHKICGPQGVGALILKKKKYQFPPIKGIMYGGQQERGIRPGTVPVALVAGLGVACSLVALEYKRNYEKCLEIKKSIMSALEESEICYEINGDPEYCIASTLNISIKGVSSEALMLSSKQYCGISNGSACNSKSYTPSYVLKAMGVLDEKIEHSVRISWGANVDLERTKRAFIDLLKVAKSLSC